MNLFSIIGNILGIGKDALENRAKLKQLRQEQEFKVIEAETKAVVDRIMSNTESDNEIDLITARDKKYTLKDEIITYLFMIPIIIATVTPFIVAYQDSDWISLNSHVKESYFSLDQLPSWYKYIVALIIVDVLGFRSFARKLVDRWHSKRPNQKTDNQ